MKINHNISALNAYRNLSSNTMNTNKSLEKLSSGLRINKASDDAAGLSISEKMRSQIRGLDMAERNALDGISLIQTAEAALSSVTEILQRMRELAVQAANGTNTEDEQKTVQTEINDLLAEIDRISISTEFNKKSLLADDMEIKLMIGANANQDVRLTLSKMDTNALLIPSLDVVDKPEEGKVGMAGLAITAIDDALKAVTTERSKMGAMQNRLEYAVDNLSTMNENVKAAESRIRDVDMALEMTEFTKNTILNQAAQAMLAQANQLPQGVLQLLK